MAVVVTGAAGFVGAHAVEALAARGADVVAVDRRPLPERLAGLPGVVPLRVDLLDGSSSGVSGDGTSSDGTSGDGTSGDGTSGDGTSGDWVGEAVGGAALVRALASAEAVLHLAGCPGVRDARPDAPARRQRDNVLATERVCALVPRSVPLVVASSSSVYGGSVGGRPCAEGAPLRPRGGYAESKVRAEAVCARRAGAGGRVAVVRPFTVVGEGQREDMAVTRWLRAAAAGEPLLVHGGPDRTRDLTDVRDAVRCLLELLDLGATTTANVGTGRAVPLAEVLDAVAAAVGPVTTRVVAAHPDEVAGTLADVRRLESLLGWVPETDVRAVVARQAASVRATGLRAAERPADLLGVPA